MAFSVSYNLVAVDKVSKVAKRVSTRLALVAKEMTRIEKSSQGMSKSLSVSGKKLNAMGNQALIAGSKVSLAGNKYAVAIQKTDFANKISITGFDGLRSRILGLATAAGTAMIAMKALRTGMDYEDQMADLHAITGASGEQLKFMSEQSMSLARSSRTAAKEVVEGFKLVASANEKLLDDPKALSFVTEQALLLKNAAGIEMSLAAKSLTVSLNQFGEGAEQAGRFVNVMAAGAKFGAAEIDEISESLLKAGPAARVAGVSFEETNALIQALARGGLKGSIAGTGLNAVLIRMQKIKGIDFKKMTAGEAFTKIGDKLNAIEDPVKRTTLIMKTFGLENVKTIETLLKEASSIDALRRKITGTSIALEQAAINNATFSKSWKLLGITIDEKFIQVFDNLKPTLSELTEEMTQFIDSFKSDDLKAFTDSILFLVDAVDLLVRSIRALGAIGVLAGEAIGVSAGLAATGTGLLTAGDRATTSEAFGSIFQDFTSEFSSLPRLFRDERSISPAASGEKDKLEVEISVKGGADKVSSVETKASGRKIVSKTNLQD